jgi:tetratricopeptide (TPR) repeat protein
MKKYIILLIVSFSTQLYSQRSEKYKKLDEYMGGEYRSIRYDLDDEIFNGFIALSSLKGEFAKYNTESEYWVHYAWATYLNNKTKKAMAAIEKAIELDAKNYDAKLFKARLIFEIKAEKKLSREIIESILHFDKLGLYNLYRGIFADNELDFKYLINSEKMGLKHAGLYINLSAFYLNEENYDEALVYLNKSIKIQNKNNNDAYSNRALISIIKMDFETACSDLKIAATSGYNEKLTYDVLCVNSANYNRLHIAATILAQFNMYKQAITLYDKLIETEQDSSSYYVDRGYVYKKIKKYDKAVNDLKKALTLPNNNLLLNYQNLVLALDEKGDYDEGIIFANKALLLDSTNETFYAFKGRILTKQKKYLEAESIFKKAIKINPFSHTVIASYAELNLQQNKLAEAKKLAVKSLHLNEIYDYGQYVLGKIKGELGEEDACEYLTKAKEANFPVEEKIIKKYCIK